MNDLRNEALEIAGGEKNRSFVLISWKTTLVVGMDEKVRGTYDGEKAISRWHSFSEWPSHISNNTSLLTALPVIL